ncbi:MAG: ABC transporter ATP-binding protein [Gemmatimonadaceae bacterium]
MTSLALPNVAPAIQGTQAISVEGLSKAFPVRQTWSAALRRPFRHEMRAALADVDLQVAQGEFVGLLGPNGAGKTTLFKILSTLILPDGGRASVLGNDVVRSPARTRAVLAPVIADERSLHWRLSATENLRLYAALHGVPARTVPTRIGELLELVGLTTAGAQLVSTFSSGMRQRLLLARALLARPRVLLLDEPTRSLDPISARALRAFLREELAARQGCSILLATHSADEAFGLCDRVAVLDRGRLLAAGSAERLAREVGDLRYRAWTRDPEHPAWRSLAGQGLVVRASDVIEEGWTRVDLDVPGGLEGAARALDLLSCAGVRVARFERAPVTLAELLDRVVSQRAGGTDA